MAQKSFLFLFISLLLLTACVGSDSDSTTSSAELTLPEANPEFSSSPLPGIWLLSYTSNSESEIQEGMTNYSSQSQGKFLASLKSIGEEFIFQGCTPIDLLNFNEVKFKQSGNTLSFANSVTRQLFTDIQEQLSTNAIFEVTNNNQLSGTINFERTINGNTQDYLYNFNGIKISNSIEMKSAPELSTSMELTDGISQLTNLEFPLKCLHLSKLSATYSGDINNFSSSSSVIAATYESGLSEESKGYVFALEDISHDDENSNARLVTSYFEHDSGSIKFSAADDCLPDSSCVVLEVFSVTLDINSKNKLGYEISSRDKEGNTLSQIQRVTILQ